MSVGKYINFKGHITKEIMHYKIAICHRNYNDSLPHTLRYHRVYLILYKKKVVIEQAKLSKLQLDIQKQPNIS